MNMKTSILAAAIIAALSVSMASAQDKPAMNMDMGKAAQKPSAPAKPAMNMDTDKQGAKTQANMEKMQQQMDKIAATTEPKERQKLMHEHMQTMQESMKSMGGMGGMGGPKMKGKGEHGGMMMDKKKGDM